MSGKVRRWNDPGGEERSVWFEPTDFSSDPKHSMSNPKVFVRGIDHVWQIPKRSLPFFLRAAREGGFIWRDGDGTPWHIQVRARIRSECGRSLKIHHPPSHRALWELSDAELEEVVSRSLSGSAQVE